VGKSVKNVSHEEIVHFDYIMAAQTSNFSYRFYHALDTSSMNK